MTTARDRIIRELRRKLNIISVKDILDKSADDWRRTVVLRQLKELYCRYELDECANSVSLQYIDDLTDLATTRLINECIKPEKRLWLKVGQHEWETFVWESNEDETEDLLAEWIDNVFPQNTSKIIRYGWE